MTNLQAEAIFQQVISQKLEPRDCLRCHGEPYIHGWNSADGCPYSIRCDCAEGKRLAAIDRAPRYVSDAFVKWARTKRARNRVRKPA